MGDILSVVGGIPRYLEEVITAIVEADGYFDAVIPFRRLMGL